MITQDQIELIIESLEELETVLNNKGIDIDEDQIELLEYLKKINYKRNFFNVKKVSDYKQIDIEE